MGLIESFLGYAKNLIVIESKVGELHGNVRDMAAAFELLTDKVAILSERMAKVEGKFEAYENIARRTTRGRKQLESRRSKADE